VTTPWTRASALLPKLWAVADSDFFPITDILSSIDFNPVLTRHSLAHEAGCWLAVMIHQSKDVADLTAVNLGDLRLEGKIMPEHHITPAVAVYIGRCQFSSEPAEAYALRVCDVASFPRDSLQTSTFALVHPDARLYLRATTSTITLALIALRTLHFARRQRCRVSGPIQIIGPVLRSRPIWVCILRINYLLRCPNGSSTGN